MHVLHQLRFIDLQRPKRLQCIGLHWVVVLLVWACGRVVTTIFPDRGHLLNYSKPDVGFSTRP
jgi:hypothetical protein